jgi:hypothetical protein
MARINSLCSVKTGFGAVRPAGWVKWLVAGGLGLVLSACASVGAGGSPEKVVEARAKQRWDLVSKGDMAGAYEFLSPASKASVPKENYVRRKGGARFWRNVTLEKVECGKDTCKVSMVLTYDLSPDVKNLRREIVETWILDEGAWWLVEGR